MYMCDLGTKKERARERERRQERKRAREREEMGTKENGPAFIVVEADGKEEGDGLVVGMPMSVSSPVVASDQACFKVLGVDSQILEVTLPSRGEVLCQPGNLVHMDDGFIAAGHEEYQLPWQATSNRPI